MTSISIIIPVYNVEEYVDACIKSVIAQTYTGPIECIIVDDCGNDRSMEIVKQIITPYSGPIKFRIIAHDQNRGLSAARNTGIKNATGEYLYFLDSDDEITPTAIENISYPIENRDYDLVIGNYEITGKHQNIPILKIADNTELTDGSILETYAQNMWYMMAWNKLCRRTFIIENSLFFEEGLIHEDDLWSFQIAVTAKSMFVVNKPCYLYRMREGSIITHNKAERNLSCRMIVDSKITAIISEKNLFKFKHVHNFINKLIVSHLNLIEYEKCRHLLKKYYYTIRRSHKESAYNILLSNGFNMKRQLRDFHLLLPPIIGLIYVRCSMPVVRAIRSIKNNY